MLTKGHLPEKSREVCIKVKSPAVIGQVTKHTTVKWRIVVIKITIKGWREILRDKTVNREVLLL